MDLRVIYLIRDPRAVMNSRYSRKWCRYQAHCIEPKNLCKFDLADFNAAKEYSIKYPDNFKYVKYEDLLSDWKSQVISLYQFVMGNEPGSDFMEKMKEIFIEHNNGLNKKASDDINFSMKWKYSLKYEQIQQIQRDCTVTLKTLGYKLI